MIAIDSIYSLLIFIEMKKTLLLSCAMVATVAASAVTPELVKVEPLSKSNLEPVTVERKAEALTVKDRKSVV